MLRPINGASENRTRRLWFSRMLLLEFGNREMDRLNTLVAEERKEIKREPFETEFPKGDRADLNNRDLKLFRMRECPGCQPDT